MLQSIKVGHILMGVLSVCLVAVVGLFLHSEYSTSKSAADKPPIQLQEQKAAVKPLAGQPQSSQSSLEQSSQAQQAESIQQPDKSLPVPAHQLKKLIAEDNKASTLDDKITQANQAIAEIDKQLAPSANVPQNASNSSVPDEKSQELDQRIEHIRNHLEKNAN